MWPESQAQRPKPNIDQTNSWTVSQLGSFVKKTEWQTMWQMVSPKKYLRFMFSYSFLSLSCYLDAPECRDYDVLSEPDRHQSYGRNNLSDSSLTPGWYRFQSSSYTRMIDSCIPHHRCSTGITGWLKGGQPAFEDSIVAREACFNGYYKCCYRKVQIRVRECQGFLSMS